MVGAYYQDHEIETQIDVHLPWLFDLPNFFSGGFVPPAPDMNPTVFSAVGFAARSMKIPAGSPHFSIRPIA